jgi:hypothetical protein
MPVLSLEHFQCSTSIFALALAGIESVIDFNTGPSVAIWQDNSRVNVVIRTTFGIMLLNIKGINSITA